MARNLRNPSDELETLLNRSVKTFVSDFEDLIATRLKGRPDLVQIALNRLADTIGQSLALADLIGRRRVLLETDRALKIGNPRQNGNQRVILQVATSTPVVPNVPFQEAFDNLVGKLPIGINAELAESLNLRLLGEVVSDVYSRENVFALALSSNEVITARVQDTLSRALTEGRGLLETVETIQELGPFTQSYAETVYRTNLTSAYSAGRIQMALDPNIRAIMPALEFRTARDVDVRDGTPGPENHAAMDGTIAAPDDPIWQEWAPPLGFNCRCSLLMVPILEVERRGLVSGGRVRLASVPANAVKHPRFGGRPDIRFYQGGGI